MGFFFCAYVRFTPESGHVQRNNAHVRFVPKADIALFIRAAPYENSSCRQKSRLLHSYGSLHRTNRISEIQPT